MRKFCIVSDSFRVNKNQSIILPFRATTNSAGYDMFSPTDVIIAPKTAQMIWTDVKAQFNSDEVLLLCVTSGMGKKGVMIANTLGVIDCDYFENEGNDGNIGIRLYNYSDVPYCIKKGDKIGQGIFTKFLTVDNEERIDNVRKGGFGSTNK